MSWFQSRRRKQRRDTDWDYFDGYPPNLRMRRLANGVWEVRPATDREMQEFQECEAAFLARATPSPDAPLRPDDRFSADQTADDEQDPKSSEAADQAEDGGKS